MPPANSSSSSPGCCSSPCDAVRLDPCGCVLCKDCMIHFLMDQYQQARQEAQQQQHQRKEQDERSTTITCQVLQCRLCRSVVEGHTLTETAMEQNEDTQQHVCVYRKLADSFLIAAAVEKEQQQGGGVQTEEAGELNIREHPLEAPQFTVAAVAAAPAKKAPRKKVVEKATGKKRNRTLPTIPQPNNAPETITEATIGISYCPSNMADPNFDPTRWKIRRRRVPTFDERLQALKDFKEKFGHTTPRQANYKKKETSDDVPYHSLAMWVTNVRNNVVKIDKDQRRQLNDIGFVWETMKNRRERVWQEKFERMERYKEQYGDCLVPWEWSVDKDLAEWVHTQRAQNSSGTLRADRKHQLEKIGFSWIGRRFVAKQAKISAALDGKESDSDQANVYNDGRAEIGEEAYIEGNIGYFNSVYL